LLVYLKTPLWKRSMNDSHRQPCVRRADLVTRA
jgi:hypothetical protein